MKRRGVGSTSKSPSDVRQGSNSHLPRDIHGDLPGSNRSRCPAVGFQIQYGDLVISRYEALDAGDSRRSQARKIMQYCADQFRLDRLLKHDWRDGLNEVVLVRRYVV